ncbi:Protein N-acetyltransferase, RimJ/RimL family [Streptoalloteichus tenebrarius]|uniref:Protein N-acetyltransferase, RimJ/RimL family n=1 Tax=Streptoalloteichus tenebrarius (strain ATCC 17920 / DSM 40477 / JCM 4838 / CBS 697.72 / NBRC 16177 / NCIMB 11028 / NRRL B-12390 / A12253. 1 / ISP 5477) TaxID=1933 RepID=A0ABT1HR47_STRSD|nr:GNAT family N-acetyltransferase [Streptoalloteichus tenebrarius]MCP2257997.1 Protein N-acetyltransferase, RimJ/RimL family [Streptoalloteichus tenebrarius]BFF01665.1 GNAT family protein [Streptoalloteichus tenebrarius]
MSVDHGAWWEQPVLTGRHVRLEPLTADHAPGLHAAGADPGIWTWLSAPQPADLAATRERVADELAAAARRERLPWVQVDLATGAVAGTTSYYAIDPVHRALTIGFTWLGRPWHRTGINTEAKLLLLSRAFEQLGALRVGWQTDIRNERSQRAIERLGARREGVLRKHRIRPDGTVRDTVQYSMTDDEWPEARARLLDRLANPTRNHSIE